VDDTLALPMSADDAGTDAGTAAGDRLAVLFDLHHRRLWNLARRMVDDGEEARDLVQETFLRAAGHLASLPLAAGAAEGWLVRTLVNLCRDRQRRRRVRRERRGEALASPAARPGAAPDPEAAAVARATLERALSGLPPRRRAVLLLSDIEGQPVARVAELLGIGRVTVRWHLSKARADLAAALVVHRPEEDR
jgi:RNA polymerase sigma-70 factor (ECF subfamily)